MSDFFGVSHISYFVFTLQNKLDDVEFDVYSCPFVLGSTGWCPKKIKRQDLVSQTDFIMMWFNASLYWRISMIKVA